MSRVGRHFDQSKQTLGCKFYRAHLVCHKFIFREIIIYDSKKAKKKSEMHFFGPLSTITVTVGVVILVLIVVQPKF